MGRGLGAPLACWLTLATATVGARAGVGLSEGGGGAVTVGCDGAEVAVGGAALQGLEPKAGAAVDGWEGWVPHGLAPKEEVSAGGAYGAGSVGGGCRTVSSLISAPAGR